MTHCNNFQEVISQLNLHLAEHCTVKFPFTAGVLIRKTIKSQIRLYCDFYDLKYKLTDYGGFLESYYLLKVEGPSNKILPLIKWLNGVEND